MRLYARNPRALLAGAMFVAIGAAFLVMSLEFRMGTARRRLRSKKGGAMSILMTVCA